MELPALIPPASWTIVMSCGVVSIDLSTIHQPVLSMITLWFAAAVWLLLLVALAVPLATRHGRGRPEASSPVVLASVAATAVLGTRLAIQDSGVVAAALLGLAAIGWGLLVVPVLRRWSTPTTGVSFIVGVATDSLALLAATLAVPFRAGWLLVAAALLLSLALAFYAVTAATFDLRQLLVGHGDHWVAGGALAIAALSAGRITEAAAALDRFAPLHRLFTIGTLVLWCLAVAWIVPLVATEVVRPRPGYDVRRWATVFPLGMYAACSFTVGRLTGISGISDVARTGTWVAVGVTLLALVGLGRRAVRPEVRRAIADHRRRRRVPEAPPLPESPIVP